VTHTDNRQFYLNKWAISRRTPVWMWRIELRRLGASPPERGMFRFSLLKGLQECLYVL